MKNRSMRALRMGFNPLGMRACTALVEILPTQGPLSHLAIENSWSQDPLLEQELQEQDRLATQEEGGKVAKVMEEVKTDGAEGKHEEKINYEEEASLTENDKFVSRQARELLKLVAQKNLSRSWDKDPGRIVEVVVGFGGVGDGRWGLTCANTHASPQIEHPRRIPEEAEWWEIEDTPKAARLWTMNSRRASAAVVIQRAARERLIPWQAKTSIIFRDRARWADSGNILDTDVAYSAAFTSDWNLIGFSDFRGVISPQEQSKCAKILRLEYKKLFHIFRHYGADDDGHSTFYLEKNGFFMMMEDGGVFDKFYTREIADQVRARVLGWS